MKFKRAITELMARKEGSVAAKFHPVHPHDVQRPEELDVEHWLALPSEARAPGRAILMVEVGEEHYGAVVVDTETNAAVYLVTGRTADLGGVIAEMSKSGIDRSTPVIILQQGGLFMCPGPFCPKFGIDTTKEKDNGLPPGPLLLLRARLVERALSAAPVRMQTEHGELAGIVDPNF